MKSKYLVIALACLTSASFATRIGVLKKDANFKCSEEVKLDLDVEDSNNKTKVRSGDKTPPGISLGGHAVFTYCVLKVDSMPKAKYDYAVLQLDKSCPSGTKPFYRRHDTENSRNANSYKGKIYPNVVDKIVNATLHYCFVPADSKYGKAYPSFDKKNGDKYGVFANTSGTNIAHSEIYIDDEDKHSPHVIYREACDAREMQFDERYCENYEPFCYPRGSCYDRIVCLEDYLRLNYGTNIIASYCDGAETVPDPSSDGADNDNKWEYYGASSSIVTRMKKIMDGASNTTYHVIKWTASASAMLAKNADVDQIDDIAVENTLVAAVPTAPAVKGLSRSIVSVELKSAGDVKISVVGVNGAVLANVTEKNLQPGDHQIKWNSGMVPSGRYIVKIEQNGMVNAKNVILK